MKKKNDEQEAENILVNFFEYLNSRDYAKAFEIFSPKEGSFDSWERMESFSPSEERESKVLVLKNYCKVVGTCYKIKVLSFEKYPMANMNLQSILLMKIMK